jgi:hypothetical protein
MAARIDPPASLVATLESFDDEHFDMLVEAARIVGARRAMARVARERLRRLHAARGGQPTANRDTGTKACNHKLRFGTAEYFAARCDRDGHNAAKPAEDNSRNDVTAVSEHEPARGNSAEYLVRRLKRDAPEERETRVDEVTQGAGVATVKGLGEVNTDVNFEPAVAAQAVESLASGAVTAEDIRERGTEALVSPRAKDSMS